MDLIDTIQENIDLSACHKYLKKNATLGINIYFQLHYHNLNNLLLQTGWATDTLLHMKSNE